MRPLKIANRFDGLTHPRNNAPERAGDSEQVPTFASAAEFMALGEAIERETAARYGERVAAMAAAGNAEVATLFRRLESEKRDQGDAMLRRAVELGLRLAPVAVAQRAGLVLSLDEMADEDPYTVTAYRALAIAVRNEQRAFVFYAYVAAHAPSWEVRQLAEGLAHEQLGHAATLRGERRKAWRRTPNGSGHRPPVPQSPGELRALAASLEGAMAARHGALAEAAAALGDLASAEALRSVATGAAGPLPAGRHPALTADAVVPAAAGAFDLLRAALVDLEGAYDLYLRTAEGRAEEDAMLDAQRWAASAIRRSGVIRGRLAALGKVGKP